jgi:uncharacterized membrane protein
MMPSPAPTPPPSGASYAEAYRLMREGALLLIISSLLVGVGIVLLYFSIIPAAFAGFEAVLGLVIALIVLLIIGGVITLIGLWGKFIPGVEKLAAINPEFGTSRTLIKIGLFWGTILLIVGAATLIVLIGVFIIIIAAILLLVGYIGLIILGFKLNELEKNTLYLVAAILFIIGIFIGIASFVGWILLYVALGDSIRRATGAPPTAPAMYPQPPL